MKQLADALPYTNFIKDGVISLSDLGILKGYWLTGPSPDSNDEKSLFFGTDHLGTSPVHLRTGDSIQVVFDRRPATPPPEIHYKNQAAALVMNEIREQFDREDHWITPSRLYLSHQFEKPVKKALRSLLLGGNTPKYLNNVRLLQENALGRFQSFSDSIKRTVKLKEMSNIDIFRDLLYLISCNNYPATLPAENVPLNKVLACEWQVNGLFPIIKDWHIRPIVVTQYPSETKPQLLSLLLQHPGYLTLSIRYRCLGSYDAQKVLEKEKPFWNQTVVGDFFQILKSMFGAKKESNQHALQQINEIQGAINDSKDGINFGIVSCVILIRDHDPDTADSTADNLAGLLHGKGIMARVEDIGSAKAIRSTWPGYLMKPAEKHEAYRHKIMLTAYNYWDCAMPCKFWEGTPYIHSTMYQPQTPTPLICGGTGNEPFFFPTHVKGVGHMLGIGSTGSGKSTFAALLACAFQGIPDSRLVWLDLGHSSYVISHLLGAKYHDIGDVDSKPLCPLAFLDKKNGLQYLMGWFERLFYRRKGFELDENGSKDLRNALMDVRMRKNYGVTEQCRNLIDLYAALPSGNDQRGRMRGIVKELYENYGHIFGGEPGEQDNADIVVYELSNLDTAPKYISTPAKELILYNTINGLDGKPSLCIWDEFWDAIGDDVSSAWFFRAIRTMRRANCGFVGLTQSSVEITKSENCNLLLGNMPGKLFFPDDSVNTSYVIESFYKLGLNEHEISRIASSQPGEFFYKSSLGSRLASCWLGPIGQAVCSKTSYQDVERAKQLIETGEFTSSSFLQQWLNSQGISMPTKR